MPFDTTTYGVVLQVDEGVTFVGDLVRSFLEFLPELIGALVILVLGYLIGMGVGRAVEVIADRIELDRAVLETPLGRALGGTESSVAHAFGSLAKWFVVALAVLAAADVLAISILSQWLGAAVSYLPAFIAGLLIIVLGFVVADFIADMISRTEAATRTAYTSWFATGVRMFLYFTAIVIGLDTMGIDVAILFVFARAIAWGLAIALALGIGIALGWGGKDYVSNNISRWMGRAGSATPSPRESEGSTGRSDD